MRDLARELGVQTEYRDIQGRRVRARQGALRAVVRALGIELDERPEAADDALAELRADAASRLVEPVHVTWDGARVPIRIALEGDTALECTLVLEHGDTQAWTVAAGERAELPEGLPYGYHDLVVEAGGRRGTTRIISAPRLTHTGGLDRAWGLFVPLYAARSANDWGIGDLGTARELLALVDEAGGDLVGSTPLLATFLDEPFEPSPYAPVSRTFWNESYLELERLPELERSSAARDVLRDRDVLRRRQQLRESAHVDHRGVYRLKRGLLEACARELATGDNVRRSEFEAWRVDHPLVEDYAAFRGRLDAARTGEDAAEHEHYHRYVQWAMETQLGALDARSGAGLYLDLPLGVHPDGFDRAHHADLFTQGVSIGAPPDPLAEGGQDWGLPPLHPRRLRETGYDYMIQAVRHLMRHASAVRVDHVMGLHRLFWIPTELDAGDGVYVGYEADEQWAIICVESERNDCMVVGEDLGTVPAAVRETMATHGARRTYVAQFELDPAEPEAVVRPAPANALATVNTHDTPTFAAFWNDLDAATRTALVQYLRDVLVLDADAPGDDPIAVHAAVLRLLARGEATAVIANLEDLWGELEPQNVPGTGSHEAPNWVRRAARSVEDVRADGELMDQLRTLTMLRGGDATVDHLARAHVHHDVDLLSDEDLHLFAEGTHERLHDVLGSHLHQVDGVVGTWFAVWAPNAERVSVIGDFNGWAHDDAPLAPHRGGSGIWHGWIPHVGAGAHYKYRVVSTNGYAADKADPFARRAELPPRTASIVWDGEHRWSDGEAAWAERRGRHNALDAPMSVYELHVGSWMRVPDEDDRMLTWAELAPRLIDHVRRTGFTHVQLMPIMEHPFYGSWGYQTTGYFAPTSRYGTPDEFKAFVQAMHEAGIGVLLDWVPSHYPTDEHGLGYFDGTHLFEHADPRQGFHPDWKSWIFNYSRNEVRSFLLSSAMYWLDEFHVDGLRVDAVASMLYLDYSREDGEWIPNEHGGRENLHAIQLLRTMNERVYAQHPDVQTIAEESTAWGGVSRPTWTGGLGFGMKWDMGWMHDTLAYFAREPIHRRHHQGELTFRQVYAYTENFQLPLSHDEVVHGKGSLLDKMPGDEWQRFANLRLLLSYMWTLPGKKLLFQGGEFAQGREWNHDRSLDWHLLEQPLHHGVLDLVRDLNRIYREEPALHELDLEPAGFSWVDASDAESSVFSYLRWSRDGEPVLVVLNATPAVRENYRVGVPRRGRWDELFNSDSSGYAGSGVGNFGGLDTTPVPIHGHEWSLNLTLPPLACIVLRPGRERGEA